MADESHVASGGGVALSPTPRSTSPHPVALSSAGEVNTIRTELVPRACWRIDDLRFRFNSSFLLPDAADELTELATLVGHHPDSPLSIFGHADPVGSDAYNKQLSGRRAAVLYGLLIRAPPSGNTSMRTPCQGVGILGETKR